MNLLGTNLMTRSSIDTDDETEEDLIMVYELADGNLEKFLWQRWLSLTGHEALHTICFQLVKGRYKQAQAN